MSPIAPNDDNQEKFLIDRHRFGVTTFPTIAGTERADHVLTLPELAELINGEVKRTKARLPWLKLATFGNVLSLKGKSYRHNDNVTAVTGIEVDYDGEKHETPITPEQALQTLSSLNIRALVYTTASHRLPGKGERWRALLPFSEAVEGDVAAMKLARERMVARVNGVFSAMIDQHASFTLSQSFYYGRVKGKDDAFFCQFNACEFFIDGCDDLDDDAIGKQLPNAARMRNSDGTASGYALADLHDMLEEMKRTGEGFHSVMLTVTSSLAGRRMSEEDIAAFLEPYVDDIESPKVADMIRTAAAKFGGSEALGATASVRSFMRQQQQPVANETAADTDDDEAVDIDIGMPLPGVMTMPDEPPPRASFDAKVDWLLTTHGYCATTGQVVQLFEVSEACQIKVKSFTERFASWHRIKEGPRGGEKLQRATDAWMMHPARFNISDVRMRPDRPFPLFEEDGQLFKNSYCTPEHPTEGGEADSFLRFLERLIPDVAERNWLLQWMAHKRRWPHVTGCAVVFVAFDPASGKGVYGTGRNTLFNIAADLYGRRYVTAQSYSIIDGSSSQSAYSDWMHNHILATCSESQNSATGHRASERRSVYSRLRELVEPSEEHRRFQRKGLPSFVAPSFCTFWLATNHYDAIAMEEDDRRFAVLSNGRAMTEAEAVEIQRWRRDPVNIGALARMLDDVDLTGFQIRKPLHTAAKDDMVDSGVSEVEEAMQGQFDGTGMVPLVFTRDQLRSALRNRETPYFDGQFEAAWRKLVTKAQVSHGSQKAQRRVRQHGTQKKLFCFRCNAAQVEQLSEDEVTAMLSPGVIRI